MDVLLQVASHTWMLCHVTVHPRSILTLVTCTAVKQWLWDHTNGTGCMITSVLDTHVAFCMIMNYNIPTSTIRKLYFTVFTIYLLYSRKCHSHFNNTSVVTWLIFLPCHIPTTLHAAGHRITGQYKDAWTTSVNGFKIFSSQKYACYNHLVTQNLSTCTSNTWIIHINILKNVTYEWKYYIYTNSVKIKLLINHLPTFYNYIQTLMFSLSFNTTSINIISSNDNCN